MAPWLWGNELVMQVLNFNMVGSIICSVWQVQDWTETMKQSHEEALYPYVEQCCCQTKRNW